MFIFKPKFSATQITDFNTCPRYWAYKYVEKIKPPPTAGAALGTRVHKILEEYQKYGKPPVRTEAWQFQDKGKVHEPGKIALTALPYIPKPGIAITEEWFEIETKEIIWIGVIDLQWDNIVLDYKTTSAVQYIKKEENLIKDPQVILYSAKNFIDKPDLNTIQLKWLYLITKGKPKANEISITISRSQSELGLEWLENIATRLIKAREIAETKEVNALKPKAESCQLYAGCFYINRCNLTNKQKLRSIMSKDIQANTDLEDLLAGEEDAAVNPPEKPTQTLLDPDEQAFLDSDDLDDLLKDEPQSESPAPETKAEVLPKIEMEVGNSAEIKRRPVDEVPWPTSIKEKFTLCIDCSPTKFDGQMMTLGELIEPIAEESNIPKALRKNLKAAPINPKTILVINIVPDLNNIDEIIQILEANAGMVIRG